MWNWIFEHSHPLLALRVISVGYCPLSALAPHEREIQPLRSPAHSSKMLPSAGIHRRHVSVKDNNNLPSGQTLSFLIPISNGAGSRRDVGQELTTHHWEARHFHPQLFLQALQLCKSGSLLRSGVQDIQWWLHHHPSGRIKKSEGFSP